MELTLSNISGTATIIVGFSRVASPFPFCLMPVDLSVSVNGDEYLQTTAKSVSA